MKETNINFKNEEIKELSSLVTFSGTNIKPPLGLIPKRFYDEKVKVERFNQVCAAIARYYDAGLKINIEWIQEYNELVEYFGSFRNPSGEKSHISDVTSPFLSSEHEK